MCYTVPLAGAIVTSIAWGIKKSVKVWWLTLMFFGAALFGVIDHWWNGELFLVSENIASDLLLGVAISVFTVIAWWVTILVSKKSATLMSYVNVDQ